MAKIAQTRIVSIGITDRAGNGIVARCEVYVIRTGADSPTNPLPSEQYFYYEVPISDGWTEDTLDQAILDGAVAEASSTGITASEVVHPARIKNPHTQIASLQASIQNLSSAPIEIPWHSDGGATLALTNSPLAERIALAQSGRMVKLIPLGAYTQIRVIGHLATGSASASNPRVRVRYKSTVGGLSSVVTDYSDIVSGGLEISMAATGTKDTGWRDIVVPARADSFVALCEAGGDGVIDPAWNYISFFFR